MTRDSPSQRKYTRSPDDRHEDDMTPTDNPYKALELTQLVADLKIVVSPVLYTDEGFARVAEALYDRGVRSRLHAPYRDGDSLVHFTWDPALEGFEITEPGVYEPRMEAADVPDIEPFPTFPRAELPRMLHRLVKKAGVRPVLVAQQMSEVPGHVDDAPEQLSEVTRALELVENHEPGDLEHAAALLAAEVRHLRTLGDTLAADLDQAHLDLQTIAVADTGLLEQCGTCSAQEPPVKRIAVGRSGRGWPRCAVHLVEDALDDAGLEKTVKRCSSCSHLASAHYEDGSGCKVTIRDVSIGADDHCPCTFDARAEAWGTDNA